MTALEAANFKLESEEKELIALRDNLEAMVREKTQALEATNSKLIQSNKTLRERNIAHQMLQTELQQILEEYREKQSTLLESGKLAAIGLLTAGMAHEINNPLNFINGAAHLLELETASSDTGSDYSGSFQNIRKAVTSTHELVKGLNQFSRRTEKMDEQCDIISISMNILSILDLGQSDKGKVTVNRQFAETPVIISGNSGKLHQAFLNLFQQVVQDLPEGSEFSIEVKSEAGDVRLILASRTAGAIPATISGTLRSTRRDSLRMYIINRIIREHRGTLLVSKDGENRKFWEVRFPGV